MMTRAQALAVFFLVVPLSAWAADQKSITLLPDNALATLKAGPGMEVTRANCGICHSTDYIVRQPQGDAKQWQAEVTKMVKVFGAPMEPEEMARVVDYLATNYGKK